MFRGLYQQLNSTRSIVNHNTYSSCKSFIPANPNLYEDVVSVYFLTVIAIGQVDCQLKAIE